jgi:intein/homing endonuclease
MTRGPVAILRTTPRTVLADYHRLMNLAGYQDVIARDTDTALKINISWHFFFPGSSTTPWQLDGVTRAMTRDGYRSDLLHACHNRTVVIDAHLGERENKQLPVVQAHGLRNVHLYEGEEWIHIRDAVGDLTEKFLCLNDVYPDGFHIPKRFLGENIIHLPTVKCVHPDTQVVLADGSLVRIAELVEAELEHGVAVLDADGDVRVKGEVSLVSVYAGGAPGIQRTRWFWRTPLRGREMFRVRLKTGREVTVSSEHPFLTPRGWRPAKSLLTGDRVAIPRKLNIPGASQPLPRLRKQYGRTSTCWIGVPAQTSPEFWRWMGYFLAEGWVQPMRTTCRFWWSNSDSALVRDFAELTERLFGLQLTSRADQPGNHYFDSLQFQELFEALELPVPLNAGNKRVPRLLFRCPADEIAAFLQGYFDGDGGVGRRDGLHAVTKSERLADALQHLLNRLGVIAFKRNRRSRPTPDEPYRDYFGVSVYGDELVELSRHLRLRSEHKQRRIDALVARRQVGKRPSNWDTIPIDRAVFRSIRQGLGLTQASSGRPASVNSIENGYTEPTRPIVRYFVERFCAADTALAFVEPIAEMEFLARDDIAWDHIQSIEGLAADTPYLYDFTMEEVPTFIGNGIFLHNTHVFTTTTGAMKNAFGGLLNERRHWTHPVIHETLVDLLRIQQRIHRGVFAVMDGTFAGDGPGPRCMIPHVKNVILASADQVAIDAVAARLMGFDPMGIKYIRLAHEQGLGCGDPREIRLVGDVDAAREPWHFVGPFRRMTFASRMQHRIYWGRLKTPIEWSLKTVLAPWAYVASVLYHDSFWYPLIAKHKMAQALQSDWGKLFRNWEGLTPDDQGFPSVGEAPAELRRLGLRAFATSMGVLVTCLREAPEFAARRRRAARQKSPA